jgi:hypothetical protein
MSGDAMLSLFGGVCCGAVWQALLASLQDVLVWWLGVWVCCLEHVLVCNQRVAP